MAQNASPHPSPPAGGQKSYSASRPPNAHNYIGPNTFAEIGVAFSDDRGVFLLQGMPETYSEELSAWGVKYLNGNLRPLLNAVSTPGEVDWHTWQNILQGELVC